MRRAACVAAMCIALIPGQANASHEVTANFYGVVAPNDDYSKVTVVMLCEARATRVTSTTAVTCSIDDGAAGTGVSNDCVPSPGPVALCHAELVDGLFPVTVCVTAYATLTDLTTDTDSRCRTYTPPTR